MGLNQRKRRQGCVRASYFDGCRCRLAAQCSTVEIEGAVMSVSIRSQCIRCSYSPTRACHCNAGPSRGPHSQSCPTLTLTTGLP